MKASQFTPSRKECLNRIPGEHGTLAEVVVRLYNYLGIKSFTEISRQNFGGG